MKDLLWVEVDKKYVSISTGSEMPRPESGHSLYGGFFNGNGLTRQEFARWSGVTFPAPGIYGLRLKLGVIERYRVVESKKFVAAEHKTRKLVKVK